MSTSFLPYGGITHLINSFDYPNLLFLLEQLDKVPERFYASACKQEGTNLSPMILKGNQMVFS